MKKVLVYFHTHWDREWYKTRVEFNFRLVKVIDDVLEKLKNNELPSFYFDGQTCALEDYLKFRPENENLIKDLIKKEKLFIGPFYCSTDSFLISVQSMLSNIDLGLKYSKEFGCKKFIGYCADTFGHSKGLAEIFNYYNFEAGIFWRGLGELPIYLNWNNFNAIYLRQGYFHDYLNSDISYEKKAEFIENQLEKIDDKIQDVLLLPLGADHLKVADNPKAQICEINKYLKNYKLIISNPFEYFEVLKKQFKVEGEFRDNSRNFILPGVFSSRIDIKQKNAFSQWNLLRIAEPMNALCYSNGLVKENYQPHIDLAKKELIKNHAHDSIYGCSTDEVHKDMLHRFAIADKTSFCVIEEILNKLENKNSDEISIINLSDFEFSGLCEIKTDKKLKYGQLVEKENSIERDLSLDENRIPVTEDFKPIYKYLIKCDNAKSFAVSKIENYKKINSDLKITNKSIENSKIGFSIKNNKIEIFDKINQKIYKNFIEIIDLADAGDSYNYAPIKNDKPIKAEIINSKILINGDLRSELGVNLEIDIPQKSIFEKRSRKLIKHKLYLTVSLDVESDYLSFKLDWENKSKNHILKAIFNLDNPVTTTKSDDMSGIIERKFDPDYCMEKFVPAKRGVELKTNTTCLQTFVESQGTAVVTKGLNEYEIRRNMLEITMLRSTDKISNPKNPARGTPAGPPIITNDLLALRENVAEFALIFTDETNKIKKCQQSYYGSAFAFFSDTKPKKLLNINQELLTATYDKKLHIRTLNKDGKITDI